MTSSIYITFEEGTTEHEALRRTWVDFCESRGMTPQGNGCYYLGQIESHISGNGSGVVFSTYHMGEFMDDAARIGMAFWVRHGGSMEASQELRTALSKHVPATGRPEDDGRIYFDAVEFSRLKHGYVGWTRDGHILPLSELEGKTVNIGDKNGGVYEGVTVAGFDGRMLMVEGGGYGTIFGSRKAEPFEGRRGIYAHDIARGYVHADQEEK